MLNKRSQLEKRLARLLAVTPSLTLTSQPQPQLQVDLVYPDQATQDRLEASRRE